MKKHKKLIVIIGVIILIALISTIIIKVLDYSLNSDTSESQQSQLNAEIGTSKAIKTIEIPAKFRDYILDRNETASGANAASGSYTLLAGQIYYIEIAGGRGGYDDYGGGAGGVQAVTIQVGSSNVTLTYKLGGYGENNTGENLVNGGYPDGQAGMNSGGGGGSTAIYINGTPVAAAGGGGGGGKFSAGTGGTGIGGSGTGQQAQNQHNGQLWYGDTVGAGIHQICTPDGGGGGGGFPTGINIYYHESGWGEAGLNGTDAENVFRNNYNSLNLGSRTWEGVSYASLFPFNAQRTDAHDSRYIEAGDYGGTGGKGFIRTSAAGCTISSVGNITGSTGYYPGQQGWTANANGNTGEGYIKLYRPEYTYPYTIEYYYDGVRDDSKTESGPSQKVDTVINSYPDKNIDPEHYSLEKVENFPLTITSNTASNVIRVYYSRSGELIIEKQDAEDNSIKLEGVKFTIRATSGVKNGQYVNMDSNGNAVYQTERCELTTGSDGEIKLKGVFVGTYEVIETYTPHYGYVPEYKGTAVVE